MIVTFRSKRSGKYMVLTDEKVINDFSLYFVKINKTLDFQVQRNMQRNYAQQKTFAVAIKAF